MRLAYRRYSGDRGFTAEEFRKTAEEVAGADLQGCFLRALASTEELDYGDALDWFGLRFAPTDDPTEAWTFEPLLDASSSQKAWLRSPLGTEGGP